MGTPRPSSTYSGCLVVLLLCLTWLPAAAAPAPVLVRPIVIGPHLHQNVDIPITLPGGQQAIETITYQTPGIQSYPPVLKPLVVAFHGYNSTQNSVHAASQIDEEVGARNWYYLAPLGKNQWDHGTREAQAHVQGAIQWMLDNFPIDPDRIYGIGFSMGGGFALSYAGLHQDPAEPRFAAVVNHTGTIPQIGAYTYADDSHIPLCNGLGQHNGTRQVAFHCTTGDHYSSSFVCLPPVNQGWVCNHFFPFDPDNDPFSTPFLYRASSLVDLELVGGTWVPNPNLPHLARNVAHLPMQVWWNKNDTNSHGENVHWNKDFVTYMQGLGADVTPYEVIGPAGVHHWNTLDYLEVFNFFTGKTLSEPESSVAGAPGIVHETVWTEPKRAFWFEIDQHGPNPFNNIPWTTGFSAVRWILFPAQATNPVTPNQDNILYTGFGAAATNIDTLYVHWQDAGLDPWQDLEPLGNHGGLRVAMDQDHGAQPLARVVLLDFPADPTNPLLGEAVPAGQVSYDLASQKLTLTRSGPGWQTFRVQLY